MPDDLEERLKSHARAFDSLLSIIPADHYYSGDVSGQWKRKKQTPEQKRAAKMAKLDPDNWKSAKDLMDERAAAELKRKRDADEDEDDAVSPAALDFTEMEQPKVLQEAQAHKSKKRKVEGEIAPIEETEEERKRRKAQNRAAKRARKQERKAKAKEKLERRRAKKKEAQQSNSSAKLGSKNGQSEVQLKESINLDTLELEPTINDQASTASSDGEQSAIFSPQHESGVSSTSSIQPATIEETINKTTPNQTPQSSSANINPTQTPRERLQAAISQLRAERKADGVDGRPPKNRQELLEQRHRKEEERKAAKKEQKRREKEEEARRQDEEIARRFSPGGSGSLLASPHSPVVGDSSSHSSSNNNFSFGRIAFEDGTHFDPSSSEAVEEHKKKGPRDTASVLKAAEAKKSRLAGLDEQKRREIEQKDMWLNAKRRAHGEHVRDDTSLLKKALRRQQGQKKKSEREWNDRIQGVQRAQDAKQKKRAENLAKRKEEKHAGGAKKDKKLRRPGFEGSFKGRTGGKKKT
ncbi:uncharacterized protein Z518_09959 [Rhinocladiella mackenziei CBS 650.93]|uniref:Ribosomal RNA-processing protein 14/surfeit locus protein 6 C-terminal domain-containing protein n=1 Tax=Rhinocladiella mackenziei CBS 650.93 TaxID=1442369 RepID=A0A0D2I509_9EURO|nr:uncharacterized protein Z518_09959 [Rhinocladiella mackenziei CBS 650.93]KIX00894.1 hypothetical protein Z518_09959 [Rhinocladiella mackenziei CBS 650.93]